MGRSRTREEPAPGVALLCGDKPGSVMVVGYLMYPKENSSRQTGALPLEISYRM